MAGLQIFVFFLEDPPASSNMFCVIAHDDTPVSIWKELVYAKKQNSYKGYDAVSLTLWKLNNAIPGEEVDKWLAAHSQNLSAVAVEMLPANYLSDYFPSAPTEDSVHVIVVLPDSIQKRKPNDSDVLERRKRRRLELLPQSLTVFKTEADPERPDDPVRLPMFGGFHDIYNILAVDKTKYIELLDKDDKYQYMFLRPQLWGKSTFLHMLTDYYDKANKDRFYDVFGDLYIGKNPTKGRNALLVLRFDFSEVSGIGTPEAMREQFDRMINCELKCFLTRNQAFLGGPNLELVDDSDGKRSLKQVLGLVERQGEKLFVGVDEYDAPAHTVLFDQNDRRYQVIAEFLKSSFFAIMEQAAVTVVDKYWITGVLPVFRDNASPLNTTNIISDKPAYHDLCGLTGAEVRDIAHSYLSPSCQPLEIERALERMKRWYGGYLFCREKDEPRVESLYKPPLVFKHLQGLANKQWRVTPLEELHDTHMSSRVLAAIPYTGEASFFGSYLSIISSKIKTEVAHRFGVSEVRQRGEDASIVWTLLYFFGVLTHDEDGRHLKVPNVAMINLITGWFSGLLNK